MIIYLFKVLNLAPKAYVKYTLLFIFHSLEGLSCLIILMLCLTVCYSYGLNVTYSFITIKIQTDLIQLILIANSDFNLIYLYFELIIP